MIPKEEIKEIALQCGFKLKQQPDGTMDLNPYVYDFAKAVIESNANRTARIPSLLSEQLFWEGKALEARYNRLKRLQKELKIE